MKPKEQKIPCTVSVLTFNNEDSIAVCLDSISDFDEVVICDGGSTDNTIEIAKKYGCKILYQNKNYKYDNNKISNFSGIRNQTIAAASNKWYMYIDSDEYLSTEAVTEIREKVQDEVDAEQVVFDMPRKYVFEGRVIECAANYPNYHPRLFHLDYVEGFRKNVHEKLIIKEGFSKAKLKNGSYVPLNLHYKTVLKKQNYYLGIEDTRFRHISTRELLKTIRFPLHAILSLVFNVSKNHLFCRGFHMPIIKYLLDLRYHLKLSHILLKNAFRNVLKKVDD